MPPNLELGIDCKIAMGQLAEIIDKASLSPRQRRVIDRNLGLDCSSQPISRISLDRLSRRIALKKIDEILTQEMLESHWKTTMRLSAEKTAEEEATEIPQVAPEEFDIFRKELVAA